MSRTAASQAGTGRGARERFAFPIISENNLQNSETGCGNSNQPRRRPTAKWNARSRETHHASDSHCRSSPQSAEGVKVGLINLASRWRGGRGSRGGAGGRRRRSRGRTCPPWRTRCAPPRRRAPRRGPRAWRCPRRASTPTRRGAAARRASPPPRPPGSACSAAPPCRRPLCASASADTDADANASS